MKEPNTIIDLKARVEFLKLEIYKRDLELKNVREMESAMITMKRWKSLLERAQEALVEVCKPGALESKFDRCDVVAKQIERELKSGLGSAGRETVEGSDQ